MFLSYGSFLPLSLQPQLLHFLVCWKNPSSTFSFNLDISKLPQSKEQHRTDHNIPNKKTAKILIFLLNMTSFIILVFLFYIYYNKEKIKYLIDNIFDYI